MGQLAESRRNRICPSCSSARVLVDTETGDVVCSKCGYVLAERVSAPGPEWRYLREEVTPAERAGAPLSLMKADLGLATTMAAQRGAEKLRYWAKRTFYTRQQRSLSKALKIIANLKEKLELSRAAAEQAAYIYRRAIRKGLLRGRSIKTLSVAAVYASCREADIPRSLDAVAETAGVQRRKLAKEYRILAETLELKVALMEPERYVGRIASALSIDEKTTRKAYSILRLAMQNGLVTGKDPRGLAAAALYIASLPLPKGRIQKDFAKEAGVTAFTLRKRAHQLKKYIE